jgi:NADH-quinone oxidoreductase subunit L
MYWIGAVTAGMTAFYVFRAIFLAFFGKYRGEAHPHESPWSMTGPLVVLAALSLGGGFLPVPHLLEQVFPANEAHHDMALVSVSVGVGLIGIALAFVFYVLKPALPDRVAQGFGGFYRLVYNKYFVDEVYSATVIQPTIRGSRAVLWRGVDNGIIDGMVNGVGNRARDIGNLLRLIQSGNIRSYATWVLFGCVFVMIAAQILGGGR